MSKRKRFFISVGLGAIVSMGLATIWCDRVMAVSDNGWYVAVPVVTGADADHDQMLIHPRRDARLPYDVPCGLVIDQDNEGRDPEEVTLKYATSAVSLTTDCTTPRCADPSRVELYHVVYVNMDPLISPGVHLLDYARPSLDVNRNQVTCEIGGVLYHLYEDMPGGA